MNDKAVQITYKGQVQGVGFRWTAHSIANTVGISGWVKNLPDGNVHVFAQGKDKDIQSFMRLVQDRMCGYIEDIETVDAAANTSIKDFVIR